MRRLQQVHIYRTITLLLIVSYVTMGFACSESDVHKVKAKVEQAANILNTAAKSNRELYRSGAYDITKRQQVATAIHTANDYLSDAVELAAQLQPGMSGRAIFDLLSRAAQELAHAHIGNDRIDTIIQSAVAAINSAILLAQALK